MRHYGEYLDSIRRSSAAFAALIDSDSLGAPVPSCPPWRVRDLVAHLGGVQRWAARAIAAADVTAGLSSGHREEAPDETVELRDWYEESARALEAALSLAAPDDPAWHPFSAPQTAHVWSRRQAHEVSIHLWDLARAVDAPWAIEASSAADFVAEYFDVVAPRIVTRDGRRAPEGIMEVRVADVGERFTVHSDGQAIVRVDGNLTATGNILGGDAQDMLLALWGRQAMVVRAESDVVRQWLAFGGS